MKKINIAYIGGGSRGWARILMNDLVKEESLTGTVRLYDIDKQSAVINAKIGNMYNDVKGAASKWLYQAVDSLTEALSGADVVIISILPGTLDHMENDVHFPERYSIYQSVGDSVGPGGIMRSVRAIPMYAHIANSIKSYCPNAYVITYTNPMTVLTKTLFAVYPEIKAFGCCHEVFGTQKLLAEMVVEMGIAENAVKEDIKVNVLGINHFTWLDIVEYKGEDLLPVYKKFVDKYYENGYVQDDVWNKTVMSSGNKVKFDLFRQYGIIAAAGDRHLAEFCPGWYLKTPKTAYYWKFSLTPVSFRKNLMIERLEETMKLYNGEEQPKLTQTGEEGVPMIKALLGDGEFISNVNTINMGQHKGLPLGAVVETNALFSVNGIQPIDAGRLPRDVESLVLRQVYNQEALVEACLAGDKDRVFKVFKNDPLVHLANQDILELFNGMFENNIEFFGGTK